MLASPAWAQYGTSPAAPAGQGGAGNGLTLGVSNLNPAPGQSVGVALSNGPCAPGTAVDIYLQYPQPGRTSTLLGTTNANASGGIASPGSPYSVTIPSSSSDGVYVLYATCYGPPGPPSGAFEVIPAGVTVSGGATGREVAAGHQVVAPPDPSWHAPSTFGTPVQRAAVTAAVDHTVGEMILVSHDEAAASPQALGPSQLASVSGHSTGSVDTPIETVAGLLGGGLLILGGRGWLVRRRRSADSV
jgi:hypothetical protein